ncbi:NUDIX domain-containing protein [uncultured Paraglaciecola sp.]|uniref:NUDIX domain-containing protein n=1 Tax=uncultured Paraglaciecola sp. TaxID=1765024 RepID=UPI002632BED7|nr:NUDIX domain-containing protein [uncultured Paraglaciecola sp.]
MLAFEYNNFNGVIIDSKQLPEDIQVFALQLRALLNHAKVNNKAVIWLTLPIELAHLIDAATKLGFTFHNCLSAEVTLIYKSQVDDLAPFAPTHSIGAGGFVQNAQGEILVIRERDATTYKLPGGHLELGEKIEDAVIREVLEETGVYTTFSAILAMASTHPYRFGKSNIYLVCKLNPMSTQIDIQDTHEIADAKWIQPQDYLDDNNNSVFNRYLIKSLLNTTGLGKSTLDISQFSALKHEVFLANNEPK